MEMPLAHWVRRLIVVAVPDLAAFSTTVPVFRYVCVSIDPFGRFLRANLSTRLADEVLVCEHIRGIAFGGKKFPFDGPSR